MNKKSNQTKYVVRGMARVLWIVGFLILAAICAAVIIQSCVPQLTVH